MYLAGDIGGTKTVLALFDEAHGPHRPLQERRFESDEYASFLDIVRAFSETTAVQPEAATLAVAGPVQGRRVQVTNLPWAIDADEVSQELGAPLRLLNDLESIANAVPMLEADDLVTIKAGQAQPEQPIAVIAPGTGLGEAFLFWDGQKYRAIPSEGGHTDFAPATALELELLRYWQPRMGHVSYERVCSGLGIPKLYEFLRETDRYPEP
ncbi:MAG: glucokinase, partial [Candidatus Promineifilaceae bacterium]|nr:glucokinase [Candidatus Promineifilaceae bacterium]